MKTVIEWIGTILALIGAVIIASMAFMTMAMVAIFTFKYLPKYLLDMYNG